MIGNIMYGLSLLSPLVLLIGVILGGIRYAGGRPPIKLIFWYFVCSFSLELLSRYWGFVSESKNNLIFLSITGVIDLLFFTQYYIRFFKGSGRILLWTISSLVALAVIVNIVYYQSYHVVASFQTYDKLLCDGIILLYALLSMFNLLKGKDLLKHDVIRVNAAVLLYFSLDLLISLTMNFLVNAGLNYVIFFWILRLVLMLTLYTVLIQTLWQTGKNPKR